MSFGRHSGVPSSSDLTELEGRTDDDDYSSIIFKEDELESKFGKPKEAEHWTETASRVAKETFSCSRTKAKRTIQRKIPILKWMPKYNIRQNLLGDIVAGLTVGVVHLPQGMAYADLASQPPINGLFVSFFPVIMFMLFGTSRHVSVGTYAVVSIMVGTAINDRAGSVCSSQTSMSTMPSGSTAQPFTGEFTSSVLTTSDNVDHVSDACADRKLELAIALAMANGLIQILMSIFRLGIVTTYLSSHLISAFTCGAAFHVLTSQVPKLLGLSISRYSGPAALIYTYVEMFKEITTTNWVTVVVSICCIIFLVIGKEINLRYHDRLPIAIPWELGVVVFSTVASYFLKLEDCGVAIVGDIPTGIKTSMPDFSLVGEVMPDSIAIAIVAFATEISLAQLFSEKHSYKIDADQELLALGFGNIVGSFFNCFPAAASLSRSVIWEEAGAKTQLTGAFSSALILCVLLWIGPLFESVPTAALASIIVVNLKGLLRKFEKVPPLWRVSKIDAIIWIVTWLAVFLLGVSLGLGVAVVFEIFTVVVRAQTMNGGVVGKVGETGEYRSSKDYRTRERDDGFVIFKYPGPLMFANKVRFQKQISLALGFDPALALKKNKLKKDKKNSDSSATIQNRKFTEEEKDEKNPTEDKLKMEHEYVTNIPGMNGTHDGKNGVIIIRNEDFKNEEWEEKHEASADEVRVQIEQRNGIHKIPNAYHIKEKEANSNEIPNGDAIISTVAYPEKRVSHLILDLSCCPYVDYDGALVIKKIHTMLTKLDITIYLASCKSDIRDALYQTYEGSEYPTCYVSIDTALEAARLDLIEEDNTSEEMTSL